MPVERRQETNLPISFRKVGHIFYLAILFFYTIFFIQSRVRTFLKFENDAKADMYSKDLSRYVLLDLCFEPQSIFNQDQYNRDNPNQRIQIDLSSPSAAVKSGHKLMDQVTAEQVMKYTPAATEIISRCGLRRIRSRDGLFEDMEGKECNKYINVTKFLFNNNACYECHFPWPKGDLWYTMIAADPIAPQIMRSVTLNSTLFSKVDEFMPFFSLKHNSTLKELTRSAIRTHRDYDYEKEKPHFSHFGLRYKMDSEVLSQKCTKGLQKEEKISHCVAARFKKLMADRLSSGTMHYKTNQLNHRMISKSFLEKNDDKQKEFVESYDECNKLVFEEIECDEHRLVSSVDERRQGDEFIIYELIPKEQHTRVEYTPSMDWETLAGFIVTVFGTICGFSFYGWNPFKKWWKKEWQIINWSNELINRCRRHGAQVGPLPSDEERGAGEVGGEEEESTLDDESDESQ